MKEIEALSRAYEAGAQSLRVGSDDQSQRAWLLIKVAERQCRKAGCINHLDLTQPRAEFKRMMNVRLCPPQNRMLHRLLLKARIRADGWSRRSSQRE